MNKKAFYVIPAILLILIITNPNATAFKERLGAPSTVGLMRKHNFFICSYYNDGYDDYFAMVGNFFKQNKRISQVSVAGSTKMADTSKRWTPPADAFRVEDSKYFMNILSYKDRLFIALKQNVKSFTLNKNQFDYRIGDRNYVSTLYDTVKKNFTGFNKTRSQFVDSVQAKK